MKNLVFNLRTAKAQAGCAKVTKSSRMAKILTTLTLLLTLSVGQMWAWTIYLYTGGFTSWEKDGNETFQVWDGSTSHNLTSLGNHWYSGDMGSFSSGSVWVKRCAPNYGREYNSFNVSVSSTNCVTYVSGWSSGGILTYYIKHPWDGRNWTWQTMSFNSANTFKYTGVYHSGNGANVNQDKANSNYLSPSNTSNVNDAVPAIWTYTPSSNSLRIDPAYTLTVNADSHGSASGSQPKGIKMSTKYAISASNNTGYHFSSWSRVSGGTCTFDNSSSASTNVTVTGNASATVKASFAANTYTVAYNANDDQYPGTASGSTTSSSHTYGTAKNLTSNGFSRTGYIFAGWATTPTGDVAYTNGQSVTNLSSTQGATVTLYAKWTAITLSATISPSTIDANTATSIRFTITTNAPLSSGYYFEITNWGGKNRGTAGGYNIDGDHQITSASPFTYDLAAAKTNLDAGTYKIKLKITKDAVTQVESDLITLVVSSSTYSVTVSAGAGGTVSPTSISASPDSWSGDITATPNAGYRFVNWTSSGGGITINGNTSNPTQIKATSTGGTLTANFAAATYRVTLYNQSATTAGTKYVDATYKTTTLTSITKPTKTNYTFGGYYTATDGGGTQIIDANGNWLASKSGFTDSSNKSQVTANTTLYAKWTETKYAVRVAVSDPDQAAGNIVCTAAGWEAGKSGTAQIGNLTNVTITVGAAAAGYKFDGGYWTLTGGVTLVSGTHTSPSITVKATAAGSAVFTYAEDLTSTYYVEGDASGPFRYGWKANANTMMMKRTGYSTSSDVYWELEVPASKTSPGNNQWEFKIYNDASTSEKWYGWGNGTDHYWLTKANNNLTLSTTGSNTIYLKCNVEGTYTFHVNYSTPASPTLEVIWPVVNQLRISSASPTDATNTNNFDLTDKGSNNWEVKRTLNANTTYTFKMVFDGAWYGDGTAFTRSNTSATGLTDGDNMTIKTDVAGEYTFTFNSSSKNLDITYPTAYTVTYGVGTSYTSMGSVSTSPSVTSGNYVIAGTSIRFTATPNLGYKFVGWYREAACTNQVSTSNPYDLTINATTKLYAKFEVRNLYIHADWLSWGTAQMTQSTVNRAVYTYEIDNVAAAATSASSPYNNGYHFRFMNANNAGDDYLAYNYNGVQTPTGSGFLTNSDIHKTADRNPTIQYNLTHKSHITITLTLRSIDDATKPTVNIAADPYYTISTAKAGTGTAGVSISPSSVVARSGANSPTIAATISPGYSFVNWTATSGITINSSGSTSTTVRATTSGTLTANVNANTYDINLNANGGSGAAKVVTVTYAAGMPSKLKSGADLTAHSRTGYNFAGYYDHTSTGTQYYTSTLESARNWDKTTAAPLYAHWTAKTYTITLTQSGETGYGSSGTASVTATYDAALPSIASLPTAAEGYAFMGYYTGHNGTGTQYYGPTGNKLVATYTTAGGIELFAYFKKAEITNLTFDAAVVAPSTPVGVTPTVAPTPTGTNSICWKLLYNNGNLYDPQPTFSPANPGGVGNKVTFKAPPTSGMYLVAAVLRTGNECDGGTKLDSITASFQVAGNHTVTVQYKCGDVTIKASTTTTGRPLNWSDEITPPEIFGYTFSKWKAGDGVTMTIDGGETTIETGGETTGKATTHAVQIKANYDGKLIAIYTKKSIIYFKNTLGWDKVYVNIMNNQYWDVYNGSGNSNNYYARNQEMSLVDGTDDIYYLEYSGSTSVYMSFTSMSQTNATNFWATNANNLRVVYPTHPFDYQGEQTSYGFNAGTPMFVPTAGQTPVDKNINGTGKASYYNKGHWRKYDPIQGETGYTLKVYNKTEDDGRTELKSIKFVESDVPGQLFKAVANLEAAEGYGIKFERDNSMLYTNTTGHLHRTGDVVVAEKGDANYKAIWIRATAAGDYTFAITINGDGKLCIQAEFPVVKNDYRVIYTDNDTWTKAHTARSWTHSSRIINAVANAVDTISFFVSKGHSPEFKIQKVNAINETTGAITWTDVTSWISCNDVAASGVYNFIFTQNGSKEISFTKKEAYTGNYYIRTNCAGSSKWDNYRDNSDHLMTYTEYSIDHGGYSHYYCHWIESADANRKNIKFCIANDYSPCISDTLTRETASGEWANIGSFIESNGDLKRNANVRFMWNQHDNTIKRAYLDPAKGDDNFLVLASADSKIANASEVVQTAVVFSDNENWIYEANVKAKANAQIKLVATWGDAPTTIVQYFKGTAESTETLITGSDTDWYNIRLIYDYKTNRLIAAMLPSGNLSDPEPINADVMFIREHQGDISQVTFTDDGALTDIKIAYGVMRFSKWTLNNKDKSTHLPLDDPKSYYERALYFISFPFEVKLSEVFGFGTYAQDWIIEYYDGAERARTGWWEGQPGFWRYVWDRKNFVLEPNKGYLLELELGNFNEESGFWNNDNERLELFFPSSGNLGSITNTTVNCSIPEHACTINRAATEGLPDTGDPRTSYNRTIFDSHWNVMPVPTYVNATPNAWNNTTWTAKIGPKFLYTWNMDDNTLTATSGAGYRYHAMHAYMVQYGGNVRWETSASPAAIVARNTYAEEPKEVEFRLEIQQNEKMIDQTFIALSNDETVSADFQFGEDMSKDFNARNANIFTKIGTTFAAGNTMPMTDQKTIVPVGVVVKKTGDYTFSIPDGTNGIGITLIDEETGIRTSLSALDYTVELAAGDYTERFWLEISPVKGAETGMEEVTGDGLQVTGPRKVMIDGLLYIVRDGKMFDATGKRVE